MRKFLIVLLLVLCIYILFSKSHPVSQGRLVTHIVNVLESPRLESSEGILKPPFDYGERFKYFYTMGPLRAGVAELTFVGSAGIESKEAYLIRFESQVGTFYDLENIYAEKANFYPIYIERNIKNLVFETNIEERYDQEAHKIEITKKGIFGSNTTVIDKKSPVHNALLLIYYCRKLSSAELKPGYEFDIVLPVDEFKITLTKIESIKVPAGKYQAYLFKSEPERIKLWIATDEKRTPLKMENLTSFGPSSIVLDKSIDIEEHI